MKKRLFCICLCGLFLCQCLSLLGSASGTEMAVDDTSVCGIRVVGSTSDVESEKVVFDASNNSVSYVSNTPGSVIALIDTPYLYRKNAGYQLSGLITMTGFSSDNADPNAGLFLAYRMDTPIFNQPLLYNAVSWQNDLSVVHAGLYWADDAHTSVSFSKNHILPNVYALENTYSFVLQVTAYGQVIFSVNGTELMNFSIDDADITPQFALIFNYATARIDHLHLVTEAPLLQHIAGTTVYADGYESEAPKVVFDSTTASLTYSSQTPGVVFAALNTDVPIIEGNTYSLRGTIQQTGFAQPASDWYSTAILYRFSPAISGSPSFYSATSLWNSGSVNQLELYWVRNNPTTWDFVEFQTAEETHEIGERNTFCLTVTADRRMVFFLNDRKLFESRLSHNEIDLQFGFLFNFSTAVISDLSLEIEETDRGIDGIIVTESSDSSENNLFSYDVESGTLCYASETPATAFVSLDVCKDCTAGSGYQLTGTIRSDGYAVPSEPWYNMGILYRYRPPNGACPGVYSGYTIWQDGSVNSVELFWTDSSRTSADFCHYIPTPNICTPGCAYDFTLRVSSENEVSFYIEDQLIFEESISGNDIDRMLGVLFLNSTGAISNLIISELPSDSEDAYCIQTAEVLTADDDAPALYINGIKTPTMMFTQWVSSPLDNEYANYPMYTQNTQYAGLKIYQPRADGAVGINTWKPYLDRILRDDPDALFVLPIWVQSGSILQLDGIEHMDSSAPSVYSLGSLTWLEHAEEYVYSFVEDFMESDYVGHIVGFMLTAGNTGEWFDINTYQNPSPDFDRCSDNLTHFRLWLAEKYGTNAGLQDAWNQSGVTLTTANIPTKWISDGPLLNPNVHQDVIDFMTYDSEMVADAIATLCHAIKSACNNTRIVGAPYGYTMETGAFNNIAGSLSFNRLLDTEDIDFVCSPLSYQHRDLADYVGWHGFADSAKAHGKLWISEDDTVTHLNPQTAYNWYRHNDMLPENSSAMLWKNFMTAYTKRMGTWWYDNYGQGGLNSAELMSDINLMQQLYTNTSLWDYESVTNVALVLDERSELYQTPGIYWNNGAATFNSDLSVMRYYLGMSGVPVDIISLNDICSGIAREYKVYIFANAFALDQYQRAAIDSLKRDSKSLVFIKLPGILDLDTNQPSVSNTAALTGFDLRLAMSDETSTMPMGYGYMDVVDNLTEVPASHLYSSFSLTNRQHMFAELREGEVALVNSTNGKALVAKSVKNTWTAYYADNMNLLTPQLLRNIYANADVFVYSDNNRSVQADANFVSITVTDDNSSEAIFLPIANGQVYEVTTGEYYPVVNYAAIISSEKAHTYVFYLGTQDALNVSRTYSLCTVPAKIYVNGGNSQTTIPLGQSKNISAYVATRNNVFLNEQPEFIYSVADNEIATVDINGIVTGISKGMTELTVISGIFKATVLVKIV